MFRNVGTVHLRVCGLRQTGGRRGGAQAVPEEQPVHREGIRPRAGAGGLHGLPRAEPVPAPLTLSNNSILLVTNIQTVFWHILH